MYGTVTRAGLPVSQVRVYPYARVRVCSEPTVLAPVQTTGADGRYRFLFQSPLSPQVGCLLVRALFETSSGTDSVTVRDIPITFTDDRTNPVPESVRVDLVLP